MRDSANEQRPLPAKETAVYGFHVTDNHRGAQTKMIANTDYTDRLAAQHRPANQSTGQSPGRIDPRLAAYLTLTVVGMWAAR